MEIFWTEKLFDLLSTSQQALSNAKNESSPAISKNKNLIMGNYSLLGVFFTLLGLRSYRESPGRYAHDGAFSELLTKGIH
jgi:hypothetical protein